MPHEICSWNLLEQAGSRLKHDGVGKRDYATRWLTLARPAEFHQMNAYQPYLDHLAGHTSDLHAVSDTQTIFANQEKVTDNGDNNVLQSNCNARSQKAGKSYG